jgi:uncharacterized protein (DUF4415 family)
MSLKFRPKQQALPSLAEGDTVRLNMLDGSVEDYTVGEVSVSNVEIVPRKPGRPPSGKVRVTMLLDPAVIAKFKATGPGWQQRINDVLMGVKV